MFLILGLGLRILGLGFWVLGLNRVQGEGVLVVPEAMVLNGLAFRAGRIHRVSKRASHGNRA